MNNNKLIIFINLIFLEIGLLVSIMSALIPLLIGSLGGLFGLGVSLNYLFLPLLMVLGVAFWAKPLITNKTYNPKET